MLTNIKHATRGIGDAPLRTGGRFGDVCGDFVDFLSPHTQHTLKSKFAILKSKFSVMAMADMATP